MGRLNTPHEYNFGEKCQTKPIKLNSCRHQSVRHHALECSDGSGMSPSIPQRTTAKPLTSTPSLGDDSQDSDLALSLLSDPDFRFIAERWAELPEQIKQAILAQVK